MHNKGKFRKQLMFDIDTKVAEQILGKKYRRMYDEIKNNLKEMGFEHVQGSGYISQEPMSTGQLVHIITEMISQYPYLSKCIRDIKEANIFDVKSLDHLLDYDGTPGIYRGYANQIDISVEEAFKEVMDNANKLDINELNDNREKIEDNKIDNKQIDAEDLEL